MFDNCYNVHGNIFLLMPVNGAGGYGSCFDNAFSNRSINTALNVYVFTNGFNIYDVCNRMLSLDNYVDPFNNGYTFYGNCRNVVKIDEGHIFYDRGNIHVYDMTYHNPRGFEPIV